jgi:hypothetical protein
VRGQPQEAVALPELQVLVATADDPRRFRKWDTHDAERVVDVDQELRFDRRSELAETRDDPRVREQHRRNQHCSRPLVRRGRQPLRQRLGRTGRHDHNVQQLLLREPRHQPPQRVELAVRRHQPRPPA